MIVEYWLTLVWGRNGEARDHEDEREGKAAEANGNGKVGRPASDHAIHDAFNAQHVSPFLLRGNG